jgi:hypothetical protein
MRFSPSGTSGSQRDFTCPVSVNQELVGSGKAHVQSWINTVVHAIKAVKADGESLKLQNAFYQKSEHPLETRP